MLRHRADDADDVLEALLVDGDRRDVDRAALLVDGDRGDLVRLAGPTLSSQADCFVSAAPPRSRPAACASASATPSPISPVRVRSPSICTIARFRSRASPFESDGKRLAISSGIGSPSDASSSCCGVVASLLEERQRRRAVELEAEERAHDRLPAALARARARARRGRPPRATYCSMMFIASTLRTRRRLRHERAQARLGDDAAARHAQFGVAAQELDVARLHEAVEAFGAARRLRLARVERERASAVAAGGFEGAILSHAASVALRPHEVKRATEPEGHEGARDS